jgi:Putative auto-transporter adhesin, head GIN domain
MSDRPKSPIKWIILITCVLLVGVAIQDWWKGDSFAGPNFSPGPQFRGPNYAATRNHDPRNLTGFDSVMLQGTATLDVKIGPTASVSLDGDDDVLKSTRTSVHGNTLYIQRRDRGWFWSSGRGRLTAHITVPSLDKLDVRGTTNVTINGVSQDNSRITISGTGHVTGEGALNSVTLIINGTGDADFTAMPVQAATVIVNGAGHVSLDVRDSLSATVNGAGDVVYAGEPPHVTSSIHGVGSVRRSGNGEHTHGQST